MSLRLVLLSIWKFFDPYYFSLTRLQYLCPNRKGEGVFRVRLTKYKGNDIILSDGILISKNDLMIKIHLHNVRLLHEFYSIKNEVLKGRRVFKQVMESMPLLAEFVFNHPEKNRIKGIIGITLINKGFKTLGFECIQPKNKLYSLYKKTSHLPIYLLSSSRFSLANLKKHHPIYLMMSKEMLMKNYKNRIS